MWNTDLPTPFPMWINNGRQMQLSLCQLVAASSLLSSIEKAFQNVKGVGIETHAIVFTYNSCEHPFERHFHMSNYAHSYSLFVCVHTSCVVFTSNLRTWAISVHLVVLIAAALRGDTGLISRFVWASVQYWHIYGCGRQYNITELSVLEDNLYTKVVFNVYGVLQH